MPPNPYIDSLLPARALAEQALSRAAGAPLCGGNSVELLIDARANFDAWHEAIAGARRSILLDNYIFRDDQVGRGFRDALCERARAGVAVRVVRDWFGCLGQSTDGFWQSLRAADGEVRTYNPPRLDSPLGWISRDHRKSLAVDGTVGFLSGVCVSGQWLGDPEQGIEPWRDTGVCLRGPGVGELEAAFAAVWDDLGAPLDAGLLRATDSIDQVGTVDLRIIAARPQTTGTYRLDQLIASAARKSLWLTDAYFVGVAPYMQALAAAAADGVDVRLLVPGTSDAPIIAALSRSDYRALLESGVRVFEWRGSMLHAKTAVADGRWARVGSSNLNLASWIGNCELDVAVEDESFADTMQQQYLADLENAIEVVLPKKLRLRRATGSPRKHRVGNVGRAATGALRMASAVGGALGGRRVLDDSDAILLPVTAALLALLGAVALLWPALIAWPLSVVLLWLALALLLRWWRQQRKHARDAARIDDDGDHG